MKNLELLELEDLFNTYPVSDEDIEKVYECTGRIKQRTIDVIEYAMKHGVNPVDVAIWYKPANPVDVAFEDGPPKPKRFLVTLDGLSLFLVWFIGFTIGAMVIICIDLFLK